MKNGFDDDGQNRRRDDRDEDGTLDLTDVEDEGQEQAEDEDQGRPALQGAVDAQLNRGGACADDTGVNQTDKSDEEA